MNGNIAFLLSMRRKEGKRAAFCRPSGRSVSAKESDCPFLRLQMEFVLFLRRFIHEKNRYCNGQRQ